ncbi:MAG: ATP-binding protein [Deltaproteobacteria bacterium]|nr:ATP-binding protein [Deltaproteobacteria bacterium]
MIERLLKLPRSSAFLLGPRGTGKSTWIRQRLPQAVVYDLLDLREVTRLQRDPSVLFDEVSVLAPGTWVVIDEIQKVPELLDVVHRAIETNRIRFLLSGSSARKLRRGGTNLLAGRAVMTSMFPLVSAELGRPLAFPRVLATGMLPRAVTDPDPVPFLRSYAETYLQEEIRAEALARNVGGFSRFLEIAARQNGQVTNLAAIARDAQVARTTVEGYFDILGETLIGTWLRPWKLKSANKQVGHSKFFFFDAGVARALSGRLPYPPSPEETGPLLETFVLGELRAFLSYSGLNYPVHFWRTHDGAEVDFLLETRGGFLAIEVKSAARWDRRFLRGFRRIAELMSKTRPTCVGVFLGPRALRLDGMRVLPLASFLRELWSGGLIA